VSLPGCTGSVTLTVSTGPVPVFSWTPTCKAFFLLVEPVGSGEDQWGVITDSTNGLTPPVTYGIVPEGAHQTTAAAPLTPGIPYDVYVWRWTGPGRQDGVLSATLSFTP
jgi:hypothetical protein